MKDTDIVQGSAVWKLFLDSENVKSCLPGMTEERRADYLRIMCYYSKEQHNLMPSKILIDRPSRVFVLLQIRVCHSRFENRAWLLQRRVEDRGDKNRQRAQFSPTNLNGSGFSQPAGTHEILFDCCNPSHLLTHRDVCECVCVWVYSWDMASCDDRGREKK